MRIGVHLPNDGNLTGEELGLISGLGLVKALVRLDVAGWGEVPWRELAGSLRANCTVILRLYYPGRLEAAEFVRRAAERLPGVFAELGIASARKGGEPRNDNILIEIHNEPNHRDGIEGWGKDPEQAQDFAWWYADVLQGLRDRGFTGLGWPGLAVSEWAHGERTWCEINRANIRASDWIGVHCYWQRPGEIDLAQLGGNWRWYRKRWPNRRIFVTEAANSSCHDPGLPQLTAEEQKRQYLTWCRLAERGGVAGVAFYLLGGSEDWAGFRLFPDTVRALGAHGADVPSDAPLRGD